MENYRKVMFILLLIILLGVLVDNIWRNGLHGDGTVENALMITGIGIVTNIFIKQYKKLKEHKGQNSNS